MALGAQLERADLDTDRRARLVAALMPLLRVLILAAWIVPMTVGALACLLVVGVMTGWDIMADWIERIEP